MGYELDNYFSKENLKGVTTIAGRVGSGKVDFLYNLLNKLDVNDKILYVSLDEIVDDVKAKYCSLEVEYPFHLVKQIKEEYDTRVNLFDINHSNIIVNGDIKNIDDLDEYLKSNHMDYVFINYVQLISESSDYKEIKRIALDYGVNVILLSQLPREVDERDGVPHLSDLNVELMNISDRVVFLYKNYDIVNFDIYKNKELDYSVKQRYSNSLGRFDTIFEEDKIYNYDNIEKRIACLKNKSDILNGIEDNIKDVIDDYYDNVYVLLNNGDLLVNGEKKYENIDRIHFQYALLLFAISNDNKIIPLVDSNSDINEYMSNDGEAYKRIVDSVLYLVGLTENGIIKFVSGAPETCVDVNNLVNIEDIDYILEDDVIIVKHTDSTEYVKLFIE